VVAGVRYSQTADLAGNVWRRKLTEIRDVGLKENLLSVVESNEIIGFTKYKVL